MRHYTVLIIDHQSDIIGTDGVRAPDAKEARRIAEQIVRTHPDAAGYQLWSEGDRIYSTVHRNDPADVALVMSVQRTLAATKK